MCTVNVNGDEEKNGIKEIAAKAKVSIGTVDRVLHNRGDVKQETKERVLLIVKELGYQPNVFAKSLSSKKKKRIAVVIPSPSNDNPYWDLPKLGVHQAKSELTNFNVEMCLEHFNASEEDSFRKALKKAYDSKPDGIVLDPLFKNVTLEFIETFDNKGTLYAFIDVDIKNVNNLGYYGQDAEQSGVVSASLIDSKLLSGKNILVIKITKDKVFSQHIESRVTAFCKYFEQKENSNTEIITIEIDLSDKKELEEQLTEILTTRNIQGIYVPNTRVFLTAEILKKKNITDRTLIGYDLIDKNVELLKSGHISYLIGQSPEEQAYKAVMALFNKLVMGANVSKTSFSPIDIIIKENVDYYIESKK